MNSEATKKGHGLTIDTHNMSTVDENDVEVDLHEYVNLVDCQRYRDEMSRSTMVGSNPVLHFPNVIGYASTQHILALYGNPRTPLLPDHYQQQQGGVVAPHMHLQSKLSGLLSPTERYSKTLSNGDLRSHHIASTQNLAGKFHSQIASGNRRASSTLDISENRRHMRHLHATSNYRATTTRNTFNFDNIKTPLNLSSTDVVY